MSAANSAARKRRAQEPPSQPQPQTGFAARGLPVQPPVGGLTLPQVIGLIDKRLTNLEFVTSPGQASVNETQDNTEEFETRFEILAEEISNLKQIVLSLQSYTMDVNKMLLEERKDVNITPSLPM